MSGEAVIGWIRELVLDCPEPRALARFWAGLLGGTPVQWCPGWVVAGRSGPQAGFPTPGTGRPSSR